MDDFYSEMKEILEPSSKSESEGSYSFFPNIYAEAALIPVNPRRWPAFTAGSAMEVNEIPNIGDKIKTPLDNLIVAREYLETAQSDVQWRDRLWKLGEDTAAINMASELGGDVGSFAAGAASNKIAAEYLKEMVDTEWNKNPQEKLNFEIFKQAARELDMDVSKVRGTGVNREFVPEYMQGDIFDRPERKARPNFWDIDIDDWRDDGMGRGSGSGSNPKNPSNDNGALDLPSESNMYDSPNYSDGTKTTDSDDKSFFAKLFGFMDFGESTSGCETSTYNNPELSTQLSAEEGERLRDNSEKTLLGWLFDGGGGYPMCNPDPSHPSNNPPLFLGEHIFPDQ